MVISLQNINDDELYPATNREKEVAYRNILELIRTQYDENSLEVILIEDLISTHK